MGKLRILHKNLINEGASLSMASGGSATGFGLSNLLVDAKAKTWRSTNLLTPKIRATWPASQTLSGVGLAFTNLILGSTFRVYLFNDPSAGALLYDSGLININYGYENPAGFGSIRSSSFAYGGGIHASVFAYAISGVRRMEIELTSAGNPDGFIEISRLIAGLAVETERDPGNGASLGFVDGTTSQRTSSGDLVTDRGTITRTMDLSLNLMGPADKANLNNLFRIVGKSQPIFVNLSPSNTLGEEQLSGQIYGKLDIDISNDVAFYQRYNAPLRIVEI